MRSMGVGSVWWVTAASLRVDQSPSSLPKAKALGSEVFRVASCGERRGEAQFLLPQATPPSTLPPKILHPGHLARPSGQQNPLSARHLCSTPIPSSEEVLGSTLYSYIHVPAAEITGEALSAVKASG